MVNENIELFVNELVIINWNWECDLKFSFIYKIWFVFVVKLNIKYFRCRFFCLNFIKVVKF